MSFDQEPRSLETICSLITDGSHFSPVPQEEGYPIVNAKDIYEGRINLDSCTRISRTDWDTLKKQNCAPIPGDVLLTKDGTIGRVVHYESDLGVVALSSIAILRPATEIEPCYLAHVLRSDDFRRQLRVFESGSALRRIILRDIKRLEFRFPGHKSEQTKIAEILSMADRAIEQMEALLAKQQRVKTGLMQDLFTRGIDEHGNLRSENTHTFKDSPLGRIPNEWEVTTLGRMANAVDPQPDHRTPPESPDGVPYIGLGDFNEDGTINFDSARRVARAVFSKQQASFSISQGAFVFGKIGTIGLPKRIPVDREYALSANVILVNPTETPSYLYWWVESPTAKRMIDRELHTTSQPAFGIQRIRAFPVPIPSEHERRSIGALLDSIGSERTANERALHKLGLIKSALMQDLLTGKRRVTPLLEPEFAR